VVKLCPSPFTARLGCFACRIPGKEKSERKVFFDFLVMSGLGKKDKKGFKARHQSSSKFIKVQSQNGTATFIILRRLEWLANFTDQKDHASAAPSLDSENLQRISENSQTHSRRALFDASKAWVFTVCTWRPHDRCQKRNSKLKRRTPLHQNHQIVLNRF